MDEKRTKCYLSRLMGLLMLLFVTFSSFADPLTPAELQRIKAALVTAVEDHKATNRLYEELKNRDSKEPILLAYIATLEALKAKHALNPYHKLKYLNQYERTMAQAVKQDPQNLEIRFMRFSVQHYTPRFLGYSKDISADIAMIEKQMRQKNFGTADETLVKAIARFMIDSGRLNASQTSLFKKFL